MLDFLGGCYIIWRNASCMIFMSHMYSLLFYIARLWLTAWPPTWAGLAVGHISDRFIGVKGATKCWVQQPTQEISQVPGICYSFYISGIKQCINQRDPKGENASNFTSFLLNQWFTVPETNIGKWRLPFGARYLSWTYVGFREVRAKFAKHTLHSNLMKLYVYIQDRLPFPSFFRDELLNFPQKFNIDTKHSQFERELSFPNHHIGFHVNFLGSIYMACSLIIQHPFYQIQSFFRIVPIFKPALLR